MKGFLHPTKALLLGALACGLLPCVAGILPPGQRPLPPGTHALTGATVVIRPGEKLENATIVIRDGLIEAVGTNVAIPAEARVWSLTNCTVYAGFIEPLFELGGTNRPVHTSDAFAAENLSLTAGVADFLGVPPISAPGRMARMNAAFRAAEAAPPDEKQSRALRALGFTTAVVTPSRGVLRGTSALRSLVEDSPHEPVIRGDVFQHVAFETARGDERAYPSSLMGVIAAVRQIVFDAQHYARLQSQASTPLVSDRPLADITLAALQPVVTGKMPVLIEPGSALMVDRAARVAHELELNFALVSCGEEWRRPDLARDTGATFVVPLDFPSVPKLPEESDWDQVSLDQLRAWDWAPENPALLRQQGLSIALTTHGLKDKQAFRENLQLALKRGFSEDDALAALTTVPAELCGVSIMLGTIEAGKLAHLTVVEGDSYFAPEGRVREVWIDGQVHPVPAPRHPEKPKPKGDPDPREERTARSPLEGRGPLASPPAILIKNASLWTCGPAGLIEAADLLVEGARITALGENVSVPGALRDRIVEIDATGRHVTPGLIDCHSHAMILGNANEGTLPSTAMVRIGDVVNAESRNIQLQLAGGVTMANLLHGSANPIGGQNCVIKLRDGESPEGLKLQVAPTGIKFALGENVKQSNWGDANKSRFPQSRMGVPTFFANRFTAARQYLDASENTPEGAVPPRRDLELDALAEILRGERLIHCHAYRQDEILAFLRTMESFNVKVATLQHVLEGYKVADEIAAHGAGGSSFADWWAYKFEVYDAIPFNAALMRERGVLVSLNSDSPILARHLNVEAAKTVKHGGLSAVNALELVTINAARQLGIAVHVGSLEPGKDADFVIWSGHPLAADTVCLETWIEGKRYHDVKSAEARAQAAQAERKALLAKARKQAEGGSAADAAAENGRSFFRVALEHEYDGRDRHCLEEDDHD
jgi:imidazolonepropionase-like amidohydrolase